MNLDRVRQLDFAHEMLEDLYGCLFKEHTPAEEDIDKYLTALDLAINLIETELEYEED